MACLTSFWRKTARRVIGPMLLFFGPKVQNWIALSSLMLSVVQRSVIGLFFKICIYQTFYYFYVIYLLLTGGVYTRYIHMSTIIKVYGIDSKTGHWSFFR